jgi:hypothetical protein
MIGRIAEYGNGYGHGTPCPPARSDFCARPIGSISMPVHVTIPGCLGEIEWKVVTI